MPKAEVILAGTTRMGKSINDSVCDKNNRVHGYQNLFYLDQVYLQPEEPQTQQFR